MLKTQTVEDLKKEIKSIEEHLDLLIKKNNN